MVMLKRKLQSRRGASMLFALLAFLVASVVSVTLVSAAVTNVKRACSDRDAQQAHLTLTSAAQLVRDKMAETRYVLTTHETTIVKVRQDTSQEHSRETTSDEGAAVPTPVGVFGTEMVAAVVAISSDGVVADYELSNAFTITMEGMEPVLVSFVMKDGDAATQFDVIFTFTLEGSEETLTLTMRSNKERTSSVGAPAEEVIQETVGGKEVSMKKTTTVTEYQSAIWWDRPVIGMTGGTAGDENG